MVYGTEVLDRIREAIDIVHLVSEYVVLKQRGRNFVGLCPFHHEKTPSFTVSPEKQIFYCFGCGTGGDIFSFVMKHEHLEFPEAVRFLAEKAGIPLEEKQRKKVSSKFKQNERLYQLNLLAARFFYKALHAQPGEKAVRYLEKRGIKAETREQFALGYALDHWHALHTFLEKQGFSRQEICQAGLAIPREKGGGCYDRFRDRLIFPIQDLRGRFIAFGGRILGSGEPKYLNSPETPVFQKKNNLYGLKIALPEIRKTGRALIMEGYMDVISAYQHGHANAVASLGTAFTIEQARLLARYAKEVVIALDGDEAGIKATLRCLEIFDGLDVVVKILEIPEGSDPDDYLQSHGGQAFQRLIEEALTAFEYKLKLALKRHDPDSIQGKVEIVNELLPDLAKMKNIIARQEYIKLMARRLDIDEEGIQRQLNRQYKLQKIGNNRDKKVNFRHNIEGSFRRSKLSFIKVEHQLLRLVLEQPELVLLIETEIGFENFSDARVRKVLETIRQLLNTIQDVPGVAKILEVLEGEEEKQLVLSLSSQESIPEINDRVIEDSIKACQRLVFKRKESNKRFEISQAEKEGNFERVHELTLELMTLQKKLQDLK